MIKVSQNRMITIKDLSEQQYDMIVAALDSSTNADGDQEYEEIETSLWRTLKDLREGLK